MKQLIFGKRSFSVGRKQMVQFGDRRKHGEGDGGTTPAPGWILASGVWNDTGVWDDAAIWKDAA